MLLNSQILTYLVSEIPDPADPRLQDAAGGNVRSAAFAGSKHLLRHISHMLPMSVTAEAARARIDLSESFSRTMVSTTRPIASAAC